MRNVIPLAALFLIGPALAPGQDPAPKDGPDPAIKTGVAGVCKMQFVPGQPDTAPPPPTPHAGATVRVFPARGEKPVAEGKTGKDGHFRIAVEPGAYRVEVVPALKQATAPAPIPVKVEAGKLSEVNPTVHVLGV
jgi:hypothetical protein